MHREKRTAARERPGSQQKTSSQRRLAALRRPPVALRYRRDRGGVQVSRNPVARSGSWICSRAVKRLAWVAVWCAAPLQAAAQPLCFGGAELGSAPTTLGSSLRLDARCEYSLQADDGFRRLAPMTMMEALSALHWEAGQQTTVYGRTRATEPASEPSAPSEPADTAQAPSGGETSGPGEVSSVFVDHCTDYLLQPGGPFRVAPAGERDALQVSRVSSQCGAGQVLLHFDCRATSAAIELGPSSTRVELPACASGWQVEVRVPSAAGIAYPLGRVASGGETPLQSYFSAEHRTPILSVDFADGLHLTPTGDPALWHELNVALAASQAHVVRKAGVSSAAACGGEGAVVPVIPSGGGIQIANEYLANELRRTYGGHEVQMVLAVGQLKQLLGELHVCLPGSYGPRQIRSARALALPDLAQTDIVAERFAAAEVCINHQVARVTPGGITAGGGARQCTRTTDTPLLAAVAGSTVDLPPGAIACRGREALPTVEDNTYLLDEGFVDVRVASRDGCRTVQTASLARIGVFDAGRHWVPVGVERYDRGVDRDDLAGWLGVRADDPVTFAMTRRHDALRFRSSSPEGLARAWNHPATGAATVLGQFSPVVGSEGHDFGHARRPALQTVLTDTSQCPVGPERAELLDDVDVSNGRNLVVDELVHAHWVLDDGRASRCIGHASFRVWEPRVLTNVARSERRQLRFGAIGDVHVGVFFSKPNPWAIGLAMPILYTHLHLLKGFVLDISLPITASIDPTDGRASRVSPALMAAMSWGWPNVAPRLLTAGVLLHAPWPHPNDELWSFFVGVNLASLIDLAGGR